jgi:hypothetical protein
MLLFIKLKLSKIMATVVTNATAARIRHGERSAAIHH